MPNNQFMVEEEAKTSGPNEASINEKIRLANIKSIAGAVIITAISDIFTIPLGPNDLLFLMGWSYLVSAIAFSLTYPLLFHFFGHEVVLEAKKRGKFLIRFCCHTDDSDEFESTPTKNHEEPLTTHNFMYSHHPSNIHYNNNH